MITSLNRHSLLTGLLVAFASFGAVSFTACTASATTFAVLLRGDGNGGSDEPLRVSNPLYEEGSGEAVNPLYEPSALIFTPPQLSNGNDVLLTVNFGDSISSDFPETPGGAFPFEITLQDANTLEYITEFAESFQIGYEAPRLVTHLEQNPSASDRLMLSFLDESQDPHVWVDDQTVCAEDPPRLATEGGTLTVHVCHLTVFALGPATAVPEPSAALLLLVGIGLSTTLWR